MSLPPRTKMSLTVSCCTGLKKLSDKNWPEDLDKKREEYKEELRKAEQNRAVKYEEISKAAQVKSFVDNSTKELRRLQDTVEKWKAAVDSLPDDGKAIVPNPLVVVAIDDDDLDRHPMLHTKAVRGATNPVWKDEFENFPLEMYLTGKTGIEMYENGDKNYRPQNLVFLIYHDDAIPDGEKVKPDSEDWKRDKPQRKHCIAKATWEWTDLCRSVGCAEFEKELLLFDSNTHKKIGKDAKLTLKVRLCAPKIKHCECSLDSIENIELQEEFVEPEELIEEPKSKPRKILWSKSKKTIHGTDCLCTACRNTGFSKPLKSPRRRLRKKVRFAADVVKGAR